MDVAKGDEAPKNGDPSAIKINEGDLGSIGFKRVSSLIKGETFFPAPETPDLASTMSVFGSTKPALIRGAAERMAAVA